MAFNPSNLFDAHWYLTQNPDVRAAVEAGSITAEQHFNLYGKTEGRSPGPLFNVDHYLTENPDVEAEVQAGRINAYDHFVNYGVNEDRSPVALFDTEEYLAQNPDVRAAVEARLTNATQHFLMYGQGEPRYINPFINLGAYLEANPDVDAAVAEGASPLAHLLQYGVSEGRDLGNGVNLSIFADDPAFQDALEAGDVAAALDRVEAVAPFLPTFEAPPGWTAPPDTPIPVDFVPPEGTKLVVPPTVIVPDDVDLPDTFEPVDPGPEDPGPEEPGEDEFVIEYGATLSDFALNDRTDGDYMWAGGGNPGTEFAIHQVDLGGEDYLEIAIGGQPRGQTSYEMSDEGVITVPAGDIPTFKFSVGTTEDDLATLLADYDIRLFVDTDESEDTDFIVLEAVAGETTNGGALRWDFTGEHSGRSLTDDAGNEEVSQNIQALSWYQSTPLFNGAATTVAPGEYTVAIGVYEQGGVELIGTTEVVFQVGVPAIG